MKVLPAGAETTMAAIETFEGPLDDAVPPLSVAVRLADDLDVGRGDLICSPEHAPVAAREIDATVAWMGEAELRAGARYALKHTTRTVRATVQAVHSKLDMTTLDDKPAPARLKLNDIGRVTLRTSAPVLADHYKDNRVTGAFILIDEHHQRHRRCRHGGGDARARAGRAGPPRRRVTNRTRKWCLGGRAGASLS